MLNPPATLDESALAAALANHWQVAVASMTYRPWGFGSHHWETVDAAGQRWFVTVDELETKRHTLDEPLEATAGLCAERGAGRTTAFERLSAALGAAVDLRRCGREFVLAPEQTRDGQPAAPFGGRFGVALYPFVTGQSFDFDDRDPDHPAAVLDLLVAVHTAPPAAARRAMVEDFSVPHRDELESALDGVGAPDPGPYAEATTALVAAHAEPIRRLLATYDRLAADVDARPVLTHGEPHPGNTMLTPHGWMLLDWDTALIAPPERDLWRLERGVLDAYADATGVRPQPNLLELYRVRWDLADLAVDVSRLRRPHARTRNDDASWALLKALVGRLE